MSPRLRGRLAADTSPLRELRLSIPDLSLREVARQSGLTPSRLSLIERGLPATPDERKLILAVLLRAGALDVVPKSGFPSESD